MSGSDVEKPTVADLATRGIDDVTAMCPRCGLRWRSLISFLPPMTTLRKIGELMSCPTCGGREIEVEPAEVGERVVH